MGHEDAAAFFYGGQNVGAMHYLLEMG